MEDSFDEDERTDEILPMIEEILSNTDTLFVRQEFTPRKIVCPHPIIVRQKSIPR